ncbi:MAG TPA: hypothetical protein VGI12_18500 [Vicinamibacterales bacterium]
MINCSRAWVPALGALAIALGAVHVAGQQPPDAKRAPAPTLTTPSTTVKPVDAAGFLQRWVLLEPIKVSGQLTDSAVRAAVDKQYFPDQLSVVPHGGETVTVAEERLAWHAVDTTNYNVNLYHFAYALNKPTSNVLFWAVTRIDVPHEMRDVRLAIGSNAASIWWLNGEEVIGIYGDRQTVIDDGVSKKVTLTQGLNTIRAAVINAGGATDFCARFIDADDKPLTGIRVRLGRE